MLLITTTRPKTRNLARVLGCAFAFIGTIVFPIARVSATNNTLTYTATDLGAADGITWSGIDINNSGFIAYTRGGAVFVGHNGAGSIVNNLFAGNGPLVINDLGHLAAADNLRSYIYRNGVQTDLGVLQPTNGNPITFAQGFNSNDVVVGESYEDIRYRAFIWQNGVMSELFGPGGTTPTNTGSSAAAINDSGVVAGAYNTQGPTVATVWNEGVPTFLDNLNGYSVSGATDINASGQVIGNCDTGDYTRQQAVIWNGTTPTSLGSLSGYTYTNALGINDLGEVVGTAQVSNSDTAARAFLWMNNQMIDLNSLLPVGSPWLLESANAINNAGQIVGYGSVNGAPRSFLLTPLPEPAAAIAAASLFGFLLRRHRANLPA